MTMDNKQWLLLGCGLMATPGIQAQQAQQPVAWTQEIK